jgi:hypothetical protein
MHARNFTGKGGATICGTRAAMRKLMVEGAEHVSPYFKDVWQKEGRPRVTSEFRKNCTWVRVPFTVQESLPLAEDVKQVQLASWETELRGIEEHLMLSVFGDLPM